MTDPRQTGLPTDAGDQLSERSGYYDESESGNVATPTGHEMPTPSAVPEPSDRDGGGTSFDAGNEIPGR